ncbi:bifunctional diaminohydroxyphosphoribosylaminopyrimidine deaminase/5-amino-6-(5-phosphoribosylamino)uracil reductase RibD [Ideonella alba]|uniref:Riboflavin biosynthesis protein RibD n=1 Tax=Ideonella alba TaxID=2824118 RepID=A0A940YB89_9BURK|nr:bifunctional diaminohydroxyphosphoribosylaminopyrimidine deaminase/5-amino-6-(5-phosphoribosylamino)uracil reductase RibD [Ideonella alba]MBQ0933354.1 bifunctional diaminohydroxyphosphoribosylaminopyrimidine deaminase/5-amino-6-(5-phosphoribosylamino)uracil reductase RibD [Ideonella alba]
MHPTDLDAHHLGQALTLARHAIGLSEPNPRVGCVLVAPGGRQVIGEGFTQQAGGPHAEVMALRDAQARGQSTRGATAYVTLEPCAHHGRTPPCCDALIEAGVARVVAAVGDPNPLVNGQGMARLAGAGIRAEWGPPDLAEQARELNIGFFSRMQRRRPWVRLKMAASLDGRTALTDGRSQWITGGAARADGHAWRARAGVLLCGVGTVLADDPRLDVREVAVARQPVRAIVDTHLQTPPQARLFDAGPSPVRVYTASADGAAAQALRDRGATLVPCPLVDGRIDLAAVLADLHALACNELHLECGPTLAGAWLRGGWVDELLLYLAPMLVGPGRPLAELTALPGLDAATRWRFHEITPVGEDLRLRLRR